ncbi:MAG: PEP-CTERM sorting domain-containing protein [Pseudomonadota bacterium]
MKFKNTLAAVVVCLGLGAMPGVASAAFIQGAISFGGLFVPLDSNGDVTILPLATGITFGNNNNTVVGPATGDFAGLTGEQAVFSNIEFNPANTPITPLWSVSSGGINYSFDLDNISVDNLGLQEINLSGSGTLMADGFDDTYGTWVFSGDSNGIILFSFSSITGANAVPEPASLLLVGAGLMGFAAARRRRARA